jgi:hypothetical protein
MDAYEVDLFEAYRSLDPVIANLSTCGEADKLMEDAERLQNDIGELLLNVHS